MVYLFLIILINALCLTCGRMDIYDLGNFFSLDVPIQALSSPLLRAAACAYATKYLSRIDISSIKGPLLTQPLIAAWPGSEHVDWTVLGAQYYTEAINLLRETLKKPDRLSFSNNASPCEANTPKNVTSVDYMSPRIESPMNIEAQLAKTNSDHVLAATAILGLYEFISAYELGWSGHLSGTMTLLYMTKFGLMPSTAIYTQTIDLKPSKGRIAIFWNFVRQDYLSACGS